MQRGYAGLRYQDVSRASGVAVASLRHYFPTRDLLRREALEHAVRVELAQMRASLATIEDPWEQLRWHVVATIDLDMASRREGWLLWLEYWRAAARDPALAADTEEVQQAWVDLVQESVDAGVAAGRFHLDQSAPEAAREFCALMDGFGMWLVVEHPEQRARDSIAAVERAARRMLGLGGR